jgi:ribosome-binding factor A
MAVRTQSRRGGAPSQRALRMGEVVRHALSEVISRGDLRDPELVGQAITVTEVKPSPDLKSATVFVTPLGGGDADAIVKALKRARGYLRAELGRMIEAKFTPDLRFVADRAFDQSQRISHLLRELSDDEDDKVFSDGA